MQNEQSNRIRGWALRGHMALCDLMPFMEPLNDVVADHRHKRALMLLSGACLQESESIIFLVQGLRMWTADIVMRALVEGTVKFAYLTESTATLLERCIEYRDVLPAISKLRWHGKAQEALDALGNDESLQQKPFRDILLSDVEVAELRTKYPRQMRNEVEGRWGFTALLTEVSKPGGAFGPVGRSLLHHYSVGSHLSHMSYEGTDMPLERDTRAESRRAAADLAHAARLIGDPFDFTFIRAMLAHRLVNRVPEKLFEIRSRHEALLAELRTATRDWEDTEYAVSERA